MFVFNDISTKDMKVVCEEIINLQKKASMNVDELSSVENSDLEYNFYGYSNVDGSINLFILDKNKIDEIKEWLNGVGILRLNDRISKIAFFDVLDIKRSASIYTASVNFVRSPYWYKYNDDYEIVTDIIINEGNIDTSPLIYIEKGTESFVDISINDIRFSYEFPDDETYVIIDCKEASAKYNNLYRNTNLSITYEFPKIIPGTNNLTINSGDPIIKIKRKDCWL